MGRLFSKPEAGAIYGNTLATLVRHKTENGNQSDNRAHVFNPYPEYNSAAWRETHAVYVPCIGPTGGEVEDITIFKGRPLGFPNPSFGSYEVFGMDAEACFERETRFGQYGLGDMVDKENKVIDWDKVDWGGLQKQCLDKNSDRFDMKGKPNEFLSHYDSQPDDHQKPTDIPRNRPSTRSRVHERRTDRRRGYSLKTIFLDDTEPLREQRTALLLRSYTGKEYNENDRLVIRSLIAELSLRTGGEYEVFLFVQVKEKDVDIWADEETYRAVIERTTPREFWNITILWDDAAVEQIYPSMDKRAMNVHLAQWLSVQGFMQENRQFDFVWNWELDSRATGHHYDMLTKLASFAKKQPRKGLWERNERFYIPSAHNDYDTEFRKMVENRTIDDSIWGPPNLTFVKPVGPAPPVRSPKRDKYRWGVDEEADVIMLSPIFDPVNSGWIMTDQVYGYSDAEHKPIEVPRRTTIVTQSRVSRRLIDIMHVENLRGNHVASEMTPQTVALLHGLKAVYAPMPVFFDRPWSGEQLDRWFNPGPGGQSGSFGSPMGFGREGRFEGSTWYYRAVPPQRLYNNWMGNEDAGIGGPDWEKVHGRPCLPAMLLHPIKDVKPTERGHASNAELPVGSVY